MAPHSKSQPDSPLSAQLSSLLCTGYAQAPVQVYFTEKGTEKVLNNCLSLFMKGLTWDTAVVEFGCQDPQVESCNEVIRHHLWQGWMLVSWSKRVLTRQVATRQSNSTCIPGYTCSGSLPPSLLCLEQSKGLWLGGQHHIVDAIQSPEL